MNKKTNTKTKTWKQHLDKIDYKHNYQTPWGTIPKLSNKKTSSQQNKSMRFGTKTVITDKGKTKVLLIYISLFEIIYAS